VRVPESNSIDKTFVTLFTPCWKPFITHKKYFMPTTLLIVDDDNDDMALFCEAIHEINKTYRCITASNGLEALQLLKRAVKKPDFVFLDLNLPFMNGKECLAEIKSIPALVSIPVIIYTTSKLKKDIDEVYKLGAANFLTKPNSFREIIEMVSNVFSVSGKKGEKEN